MIHLVTDGTAGLPYALALKLGVRVVPVSYAVGDRQYAESFLDRNADFDRMLSQGPGKMSTAHPPVSVFGDFFRNLTKNGDQVLCPVISSRLSGTFSSANIAARELSPGSVLVVDSLTTAGGLSLLVEEAARLIDLGLSLEAVARAIEHKRESVGLVFSVNDMTSLRRSGRLGPVRQSIGNMLNVRPILTCDEGVVNARGITRGSAQTLKALVEHLPEDVSRIIIHHQGEKNDPAPLEAALRQRFPDCQITIRPVGPTLRIHLGEGFIGIAWIK